MNPAHLDLLRCPACRGRLSGDGPLSCGACARTYPVSGGIPRFLPEGEASQTRKAFNAQFEYFGTSHARAMDPDRRLRLATGLGPEDFKGKRVLDAGCGPGRFSKVMASWGAEVLALDFSEGIVLAARELEPFPSCSAVQGDLACPPFAPGSFDLVFSIGVLHHTSDPEGNTRKLAALVAPGGALCMGVYGPVPWLGPVYAALRAVTTRLPTRLLYWASWIAVPLAEVPLLRYLCCPWMSPEFPPVIRRMDTFDWYSPGLQSYHPPAEVRGWLERDGLFREVAVAAPAYGTFLARRAP